MTSVLLALPLLLQCQIFGSRPVVAPAPNTSACGIRFWLPPLWRLKESSQSQPCSIQLVRPDFPNAEDAITLNVQKGTLERAARAFGFERRDGRWKTWVNALEGNAGNVAFGPWHGLIGGYTFRANNAEGSYAGIGEGFAAVIADPAGNIVGMRGPGLWVYGEGAQLLCSVAMQAPLPH